MHPDPLTFDLFVEICQIPIIDPHSHIDPRHPASRTLDDILGYHYYTELAHSTGMDKTFLATDADPRDRIRQILYHASFFDNTAQYQWLLDIAQSFLGFEKSRITLADCTWLCDTAEQVFAQPDWEEQVLRKSNIEKVFLTNDFDDTLEGFDTNRYVPCLRCDDLVFRLHEPVVRARLAKATGNEIGDHNTLRAAISKLFEQFKRKGAKACAISLPPTFHPMKMEEEWHTSCIEHAAKLTEPRPNWPGRDIMWNAVFWLLAEHCRDFSLPFDLMIGVNRGVYPGGVYQGQDLFDQRTSLIQYAELFNDFPGVTFCVSVLTSAQNQELASYSWIFPNVVTSGHWWYSNIPAYIEHDARARLQSVPKTKQIGYYSDIYKLEFGLPKYNMYRRILAKILADDFIRPGLATQSQALEIARLLLRDNAKRIFDV